MRYLIIFLGITFTISFVSCGEDGEDGQAYLSINYYSPEPSRYWDDNYDIPYNFTWGYEYITRGGITYNYEYEYSDGHGWQGTNYIYTPFNGEPGGLFSNGVDGEDSYCEFYCDYDGTITYEGWRKSSNVGINDTIIFKDGYQFKIDIIHGFKDTIVITQSLNDRIISVNRKWRKDKGIALNKTNKLK